MQQNVTFQRHLAISDLGSDARQQVSFLVNGVLVPTRKVHVLPGLSDVFFQGPRQEGKVAVHRPMGPLGMAILAGSLQKWKDTSVIPLNARQQVGRVLLLDRSEGMDKGQG